MVKTAIRVAAYSFRLWGTNIRFPILFILIAIFLWVTLAPIKEAAYSLGYAINPFILPFIISSEGNQLIFSLGLLFLFSDAPFINESQIFVIQRTGRRAWVLGQIFYVVIAAAFYLTFIVTLSLLILMPVATLNADGWGKMVSTLAYTDTGQTFRITFSVAPKIIESCSPIQALLMQIVFEQLSFSIIGLLVFFVSLAASNKLGIFAGGVVCLLDLLIVNTLTPSFLWVSPLSMARLSVFDFAGGVYLFPTPDWALCFDAVFILVLISVVILTSRKMILEVSREI